jgi:hypothetical protein
MTAKMRPKKLFCHEYVCADDNKILLVYFMADDREAQLHRPQVYLRRAIHREHQRRGVPRIGTQIFKLKHRCSLPSKLLYTLPRLRIPELPRNRC